MHEVNDHEAILRPKKVLDKNKDILNEKENNSTENKMTYMWDNYMYLTKKSVQIIFHTKIKRKIRFRITLRPSRHYFHDN